MIVPLKYLGNFWRALKVSLINCEINFYLTWCTNCVIYKAYRTTTLAIADNKLYVPFLTLSTQDNAKLLEQLKSGYKQTTNLHKYQRHVEEISQGLSLNRLIDPNLQG